MEQAGDSKGWKTTIEEYFGDMPDPRTGPAKLHELIDIFSIVLLGVISGADDWEVVADFGEKREEWLKTFLALPNGIPSHDTFNRVFSLIRPEAFEGRYLKWMEAVVGLKAREQIALDGKTLCGSVDKYEGQDAIKMISACAVESGLVLAQQAVPDDTNEIGSMPELLKLLGLKGCIVTVDAANCQVENAKIICAQGGDYIFALKGNQQTLLERVRQCFEGDDDRQAKPTRIETRDEAHGRSEWRQYTVLNDKVCIEYVNRDNRDWRINSIIRVERERKTPDKTEHSVHYYCSSLDGTDAPLLAKYIRSHWAIENKVHWILDVTFREDRSRVRTGFGPENLATLRHMALNFLKREKSVKKSINRKRFAAALDPDYLLKVLHAGLAFA